jgi:hypothetical protein
MLKKLAIGLAAILWVVLPAALHAQEFSADLVEKLADGKLQKGRIYHTVKMDRYDSSLELKPGTAVETHMITDREQKLIYVVESQEKLILVNYALQAVPPGRAVDDSCAELVKALASSSKLAGQDVSGCKPVGSENASGRSTAKWEAQGGTPEKCKIFNWGRSLRASLCFRPTIASRIWATEPQ